MSRLSLALWLLSLSTGLGAAVVADPPELAALLARAEAADLAARREWHTLLHYRPVIGGEGWVSDADDPHFFLAPDGKTNPRAELAATLRAFLTAKPVGIDHQPAPCVFIARYRWLQTALPLDRHQFSPHACAEFQRWVAALNVAGVSLVFASAYFNNPASLFGHLFLRLDQPQQSAGTDLLAYAVNYAADTTGAEPWRYAVDGLTGQFQGQFQVQPYYQLLRVYSDLESRDLWEYRLNLTPAQQQRLLEHLWELRGIHFNYYFLRENCAWQLLTLLEAAEPRWSLSEAFTLWAAPAEVIRLLRRQPGLLGTVSARPGRGSVVRRRYATLAAAERRLVRRLLADPATVQTPAFQRLPAQRQALLLELALDERQRREAHAIQPGQHSSPPDAIAHRLLTARHRLAVAASPVALTPYATRPETGHASRRLSLSSGRRAGHGFGEIGFRAAYHDLLEPDQGYTPDGGIEVFNLAWRQTTDRPGLALERLTVLDMRALPPFTALHQQPSWRIHLGWEPDPGLDPDHPTFSLGGSLGWTTVIGATGAVRGFVLPGLIAQISDEVGTGYRVGWSVETGLLLHPAPTWKLWVSATWLDYRLGEASRSRRWAVRHHWQLAPDWALIAEGGDWDGVREFRFGLQTYF